jgi:predicted transglutaminase-like cysteine proteinase
MECERHPDRRISNALSRGQRWRDLNRINTAVNSWITPEGDAAGRRDDDWILFPYSGNCADFAVTKRHLLLENGWPSSFLLLAEVVLCSTGEHHLVLLAKEANATFVLDSLTHW